MNINLLELQKAISWHRGMAKGIEYAIDELIRQAQQGAEGEVMADETPVQEL